MSYLSSGFAGAIWPEAVESESIEARIVKRLAKAVNDLIGVVEAVKWLPPSVAAATYSGPDERFMIRTICNPESLRRWASLIQNGKVVEKYCGYLGNRIET